MNYICSKCMDERRFLDPKEAKPFDGWGAFTAGLAPLLRFLFIRFVFKPVCLECGTSVNWAAQEYLAQSVYNHSYERREQSEADMPQTRFMFKRLTNIPDHVDRTFDVRETHSERQIHSRLTWNHNAGTSVRVRDEAGNLIAKCPTTFTYYSGAFLLDQASCVVLYQSQISGSRESLLVFRKVSFCIRPWRLPRWKAIAGFESESGFGHNLLLQEVIEDRAILLVGSAEILFLDTYALPSSFSIRRMGEIIIDATLSSKMTALFVSVTIYDDIEQKSDSVLRIINLKDGGDFIELPTDKEIQKHQLADNGSVLAIAEEKRVQLYSIRTGTFLGALSVGFKISSLRFSNVDKNLLKINDQFYYLTAER